MLLNCFLINGPQLCSPMCKTIVWLRAICTVCYCSDDHFSVCIFESELKIVLMSFDLFLKFILTPKKLLGTANN